MDLRSEPGPSYRFASLDLRNGRRAQLVAYLDPATGLISGVRYPQDLQQGKVWTVEIWTDYRDVQGMKFPFHRLTIRGGQKFSEDELQEVKINTNPNPSVFAKPQ